MFAFYSVPLALVFAAFSNAQAFNCVVTIPPNPLTAAGLATPYKVTGCNQIDFANQGTFVEAAILDPATGAIQIYHPLVINQDNNKVGVDFIAPITPTLPANAVVGIWFGSNAQTVQLVGTTQGCVNGLGNSLFGQFAYCNGPAFFTAAQAAVAAGLLTIPPPGQSTKAATVQACPTLRDFRIVDMDQSDNVDTTYLLINGKQLAQNTAANAAANKKNSTVLSNGSDNALVNSFISPAMGCGSFTTSSITAPNGVSGGLALNELQGQFFPPAVGPALVPLNSDFTVLAGNNGAVTQSLAKTNLYRAGVGQPLAADNANASGTTYCQQYAASGIFIAQNQALFTGTTSPAPAVANNLFTFMANRFATSFGPVPSLGCATIFGVNVANIVKQTMNGNGVVTAATINTAILQKILNGGAAGAAGASSAVSSAATTKTAKNGATAAASPAVSSAATAKTGKAAATTLATSASPKGGKAAKGTGGATGVAQVSVAATPAASSGKAAATTLATSASAKGGKAAKGTGGATGVAQVSVAATPAASSGVAAASGTGAAQPRKGTHWRARRAYSS